MNAITPSNAPRFLSAAQDAYALALVAFETASIAAEADKIEAGIDYTGCETDAAIDAMATREGAIDDARNVGALRDALTQAEAALAVWGIAYACALPGVTAEQVATLRDLEKRAAVNVVARGKVVALCFRLAA